MPAGRWRTGWCALVSWPPPPEQRIPSPAHLSRHRRHRRHPVPWGPRLGPAVEQLRRCAAFSRCVIVQQLQRPREHPLRPRRRRLIPAAVPRPSSPPLQPPVTGRARHEGAPRHPAGGRSPPLPPRRHSHSTASSRSGVSYGHVFLTGRTPVHWKNRAAPARGRCPCLSLSWMTERDRSASASASGWRSISASTAARCSAGQRHHHRARRLRPVDDHRAGSVVSARPRRSATFTEPGSPARSSSATPPRRRGVRLRRR